MRVRTFPSQRLLAGLLLLAGIFLAGCSHYQLGTGAEPKFRTLYVEPVANKTMLPQSRAPLSTQVREAFARDARVALANSADDAQATLAVTITEYRREVRAVRQDDTGLARKFDLTLTATCTLRTRDGQVVFENRAISAQRERLKAASLCETSPGSAARAVSVLSSKSGIKAANLRLPEMGTLTL